MAEDEYNFRRHQPAYSVPEIPLQDLAGSSSALDSHGGLDRHAPHRRTLSERGRALFRAGREKSTRSRYAPVEETSPPDLARAPRASPMAYVTSPSGQHQRIPDEDDESHLDPIADLGAFQDAIGFAGLSSNDPPDFETSDSDTDFHDTPSRTRRASHRNLPSLHIVDDQASLRSIQLDDGPAFFSPGVADEDDRMPLTDAASSASRRSILDPGILPRAGHRSLRSGLGIPIPRSPDRPNSVGFGAASSRLGDDLAGADVERQRSLSLSSRSDLSSPFRRTSTMLRHMSQRVVNVSNEPELVEREIKRKSSTVRHSRSRSRDAQLATAGDGAATPPSPASEKLKSNTAIHSTGPRAVLDEPCPLRGKSLGIFSPDAVIRRKLLDFLINPWFEPLILLLIITQTVILTIDSARDVYRYPRTHKWGYNWTDYCLFAIFVVYTAEICIKIIVSGFILNPREYSTIDREIGFRRAIYNKTSDLFALQRKPTVHGSTGDETPAGPQPSLFRAFTTPNMGEVQGSPRQAQKRRLAYRAFLRHSFNRVDFLAVLAYWISFVLSTTGIEFERHVYVFRMLSCLRIVRLLGITSGTSIILRSLKRAAPSLLNVAFLISFFWLIFAIIGLQSFQSSLRRTCIWNWDNAIPDQQPFALNQIGSLQFCGSWLASNGTRMPWLRSDKSWGGESAKGYTCPIGSFCIEGANPYNGTVSYDNILQSIELVFVIMTSNTFTDLMYYVTNSDYLAAALFSAFGIVILSLWLISLLIAVITSSFQVIREESHTSAFTAEERDPTDSPLPEQDATPAHRASALKRTYDKFYWFWIVAIVFGLIAQCLRHATMHPRTAMIIDLAQRIVTLILLAEIIFRFLADWRDFPRDPRNWFDLLLAVVTCLIQIPAIHQSREAYAWLTVFQILRIYRVVLAVKLTSDLIHLVFRHVSGVLNLILFVFLFTFLAAIFAVQLFRGELPSQDDQGNDLEVNFSTIYNAFLGMYQLLSSENWTSVLYNVTRFGHARQTAWIGATFLIMWYIMSNFIVLNMFIAVIQENFDVSEDQKRLQQVRMFLQQRELGSANIGTLSLSSVFKFGLARRQDPLDYGNAATEMLLKDQVVKDFLNEIEELNETATTPGVTRTGTNFVDAKGTVLGRVKAWFEEKISRHEANPFYARLKLSKAFEDLDPRTLAKEVVEATERRKVTQREYLRRHPNYNTSLYIFKPGNPVRKFCQRIVGPGRGSERYEGVAPNPTIWYATSAFIYAAIVAMVLLACVTTPLYQREWFERKQTFTRFNWFVFSDMGFAALFTAEAAVKVIADGFFWTPNAYFRSSWGFIDGIVLITLWVNVIASLYDPGSGSRAVGAFKALRALRLLNISDSARDTFHSVIILGGWKVASAAFVSLSLLIPFAIYGLNLFSGQMISCNDGNSGIYNLTDCVGEYMNSPYNWEFPAPRVPGNSYYDFDDFGSSLFILFQIVSQEGWIDVMNSAQAITGVFTQPSPFTSQGNALFFVIFNLLGAVFVLTLFVSVFMRNYTEQTGVAFLTIEQRSWLELRKLLRQVAPSKRPGPRKQKVGWQDWCYRRAITKSGRWQRIITGLLIVQLILLCLEWYPESTTWMKVRAFILLVFTFIYATNVLIRIIGLSWTRFRKSAWDVYSVFAIFGSLATTILFITSFDRRTYFQAHKLFLVSVVLLLIPRNNQLDQLFKTAAASFTAIANLLATWFVLFLVFAIAFTQTFGLTRFGDNENDNVNFRTVPKALILLFRFSMGEGWNQVMQDFSGIVWPYCTVGERYYDGDCGSDGWARALFVSWNILSMYLFANLFISLIYESFAYVYQRSSRLSVISREEIRRFKQAWAMYDPKGTGFISKAKFPRFLGELSGIFEMRIYDGDFSVGSLVEDCKVEEPPRRLSALPVDEEPKIDLAKLNARLAELPVEQIRKRRRRMNTFYEEVLVSADPERGVSFNSLLMILAHYKVINDNKSLKLDEFLRRRARLQRVEEAVSRNVVVGFFDTLYYSRRFRRIVEGRRHARITAIPQFDIPEIFVQDEDASVENDDAPNANPNRKQSIPSVSITAVAPELDVTALQTDLGGCDDSAPFISRYEDPEEVSSRLSTRHRPSPSASSIQPDWHFAAAIEQATTPPTSPGALRTTFMDDGTSERDSSVGRDRSNSAVSSGDVAGMLQQSAWGESVRRSFTHRRQGSRGSRSPGA